MTTIDARVRWSDNTKELANNIRQGINVIDAMKSSVDRTARSLGGEGLFAAAHKTAAAVLQVGGASKLTAAEQDRVNAILTKAIEKYQALGKTAPSAMIEIANATKRVEEPTGRLEGSFAGVGKQALSMATGFLTAQVAMAAVQRVASALGDTLVELTLHGAAVSDVEENYQRLTAQAGLLSDTLLGELRAGTHNTITDFDLMTRVNQNLAAGLTLTEKEFGTLAKGAFALAQATGVDVKQALDTMNDAMLTGRTQSLALLTGKIDETKAEQEYAHSLGTTAEHLTEEAKLQSHRIAILQAVGEATERLGEQTDGLDERVQQAQVAWQNFKDELGKTVATSKVLETGLQGVKQILIETFGGNQQTLIEAVARAIEEAEIKIVEFAKAGVEGGAFLIKTYLALKEVFGDLLQVIDIVRLGQAVGVLPGQANAGEALRLIEAIRERGKALQESDAQQARVDESAARLAARLEELRGRMVAAKQATTEVVAPLQSEAAAHDRAGVAAKQHGDLIKQTAGEISKAKREAEAYAAVWEILNSRGATWRDVLAGLNPALRDNAVYYASLGASVAELTSAFPGLTKAEAEAAVEAAKFADQMKRWTIESPAKAIQEVQRELETLIQREAEARQRGFAANAAAAVAAERDLQDRVAKISLSGADYQRYLIRRTSEDKKAALDKDASNYQDAMDAIERDTEIALAAVTDDWEGAVNAWVKALDVLGLFGQAFDTIADHSSGAFRQIAADVGQLIGVLQRAIRTWELYTKAGTAAEKAAAFAQGAANVAAATSGGSEHKAANIAGGAMAGAQVGFMVGKWAGPWGMAVGAGVGALIGWLRSLGPTEGEKAGRALVAGFEKGFGGFGKMQAAVAAAYLATGKTAEDANRDIEAMFAAEKQGADATAAAIKKITDQMDLQRLAAEALPGILADLSGGLNQITPLADKLGAGDQAGFDRLSRLTLATVETMRAAGKSEAEIFAAIGPSIDKLSAAQEKLGFTSTGALAELLKFRQIDQQFPEIGASIDGAAQMLDAFAKTGRLTQQTFEDLSAITVQGFNQMVAAGASEEEALRRIQPNLQKIWELQQKGTLTVDDQTQSLLDKAEAQDMIGESFKEIGQQQLDILKAIAVALGATLPDAATSGASKTKKALEEGTKVPPDNLVPLERQLADGLADAAHLGVVRIRGELDGIGKKADSVDGGLEAGILTTLEQKFPDGAETAAAAAETAWFDIGDGARHLSGDLRGDLITALDQELPHAADDGADETIDAFETIGDAADNTAEDIIGTLLPVFSDALVEAAEDGVAGVIDALGEIPSDIDIDVNFNLEDLPDFPDTNNGGGGVASGGFVTPHGVQRFGFGGFVRPWSYPTGADSIPAYLSPWELVLNGDQQDRNLALLRGGLELARELKVAAETRPVPEQVMMVQLTIQALDGQSVEDLMRRNPRAVIDPIRTALRRNRRAAHTDLSMLVQP